MLYVSFADGYVTVSHHPWGHAGIVHELGPVEDEFADTAVASVAKLLRSLGHRVITPDDAPGRWVGRVYHPDPDDLADAPALVH